MAFALEEIRNKKNSCCFQKDFSSPFVFLALGPSGRFLPISEKAICENVIN
jgi:hypothetical protein